MANNEWFRVCKPWFRGLQVNRNYALILNTNLMPAGAFCDKQVECQRCRYLGKRQLVPQAMLFLAGTDWLRLHRGSSRPSCLGPLLMELQTRFRLWLAALEMASPHWQRSLLCKSLGAGTSKVVCWLIPRLTKPVIIPSIPFVSSWCASFRSWISSSLIASQLFLVHWSGHS